jgi:hypothetical protein
MGTESIEDMFGVGGGTLWSWVWLSVREDNFKDVFFGGGGGGLHLTSPLEMLLAYSRSP